jgi:cytoplasmic iron level regulating protein YaaA (DUF328/UPF0246 family)
MKTIFLISCAALKRNHASSARDLYLSPLFRKAAAYVERRSGLSGWFILSALHGLIDPTKTIEPYNQTLNDMKTRERKEWAARVLRDLLPRLHAGDEVVILAGNRYREFLEQSLATAGIRVKVPMKGLRIGEQLQWLDRQLRAPA